MSKKIYISFIVLLSLALFSFGEDFYRWDFRTADDYEVSDSTNIFINTNGFGSAELVHKNVVIPSSSPEQHLQVSSMDGVSIGPESMLMLTADGSLFSTSGVYRSRIFDKGDDSDVWEGLFCNDIDVGSVEFRLRASSTPVMSGEFVGPDDYTNRFYTGGANELMWAALYSGGERYIQYEARLFADAGRTNSPQIDYVKFVTSSGAVYSDSTAWDFDQGELVENVTNSLGTFYSDDVYVENNAVIGPSNLSPYSFAESNLFIGLWHFDDLDWSDGVELDDSTESGNYGFAENGATSAPNAAVGFAAGLFDGVDDYVSFAFDFDVDGTNFGVGLWFNSEQDNRAGLMSTYAATGSWFSLELNGDGSGTATGRVAFAISDGMGAVKAAISPNDTLNDGEWHHVIGMRSSDFIHLYVDGDRVASTSLGDGYGALDVGSLHVGRNGSGTNYFSGTIDEVIAVRKDIFPQEVGLVFGDGYRTSMENEIVFEPVDYGTEIFWDSIDWSSDGVYGVPFVATGVVVALWHMDEGFGTGVASDSSGNGYQATVEGAEQGGDGRFASGVLFDGVDDYMEVSNNVSLESTNFTVSLWVNPDDVKSAYFVDKSTVTNGYALYTDGYGSATFEVSGEACSQSLPLLENSWSHLAGTFDGNEIRLYVNGDLVATQTNNSAVVASVTSLYIGRSVVSSNYFRGVIDEVAYHSEAIAEADIVALYRSGVASLKFQVRAGNDNPPAGSFHGPDGTSNSYFNVSSNGNLSALSLESRYLQTKAYVSTEDHAFSPILHGVTVMASGYSDKNPSVWVKESDAFPFVGTILDFDTQHSTNENTDVRYQISGDSGESPRWFHFNSLIDWDESTSSDASYVYDYETSSKEDINIGIGEFNEQVYGNSGGVFRVKAFLHSSGENSVALEWIEVFADSGWITLESPNDNEMDVWLAGLTNQISWSWAGAVSSNSLILEYSLDGEYGPWVTIDSGISRGEGGAGSYGWLTPEFTNASENVVIRISDENDSEIMDLSDGMLTITPDYEVTTPVGSDYWYLGETNTIEWNSSFAGGESVNIYLALDGVNYLPVDGGLVVAEGVTNAVSMRGNSYMWHTPYNPNYLTENGSIMVTDGDSLEGVSDELFTMAGLVVTKPTTEQKIERNASGGFDIEWVSLGGGAEVEIDISFDGGVTFETNQFSNVVNSTWVNTTNWMVTQPATDMAVLRIRSLSDEKVVGLSGVFSITEMDMISPNGGEEWLMGSTNTIEWSSQGIGDYVNIYYTSMYDGSNSVWATIEEGATNSLSYDWIVGELVSSNARVKVSSALDSETYTLSDNDFTIAGVRVTYPNSSNDTVVVGLNTNMTHEYAPSRWDVVKLEISYDQENSWELLGDGADNWTLGMPFNFSTLYPSSQTKVRATVLNATQADMVTPITNVFDVSDEYFVSAGILLDEAIGGTTNAIGDSVSINWVSAGAGSAVDISYSSSAVSGDVVIASAEVNNEVYPGTNEYHWVIPSTTLPTEDAVIKIVAGGFTNITDSFLIRGVRVTRPVVGDVWNLGSQENVNWVVGGISTNAKGSIYLSVDGGSSFVTTIATNLSLVDAPSYSWDIDSETLPTTSAMLRFDITNSDNPEEIGVQMFSDLFTLRGLKVVSPESGDVFAKGTTNTVEYISAGVTGTVEILYSIDGGSSFDSNPIASGLTISDGTNVYDWDIGTNWMPSANAVIKIVGSVGVTNISETFSVGGINLIRPVQNDMWVAGEQNLIEYISIGTAGSADLQLVYEDETTYEIVTGLVGPVDGSATVTNWSLPLEALRGEQVLSNVVLRVHDDQGLEVISDPFRLSSLPRIEIINPLAGEFLKVGENVDITWVKGGQMSASDFIVLRSDDGFVTATNIPGSVQFNPGNNTFVMPWMIDDQLGEWELLVTNIVNSSLFDCSGNLGVVGDLEMIYPNGDGLDPLLRVSDRIDAEWSTIGSVSNVNLFYKTPDSEWIKLNPFPIANNNGPVLTQTVYQVDIPDVETDSMQFRVQDASYLDVFAGDVPGPFDDSDALFAVAAAITPRIAVTKNLISQHVVAGSNADMASFGVRNSGTGTMSYQATSIDSWIQSVTPSSESSSGETDQIEVVYQTAALSPGSYTGSVVITSADALNAPVTVAVVIDVFDPAFPHIEVSLESIYMIAPLRLDSVSKTFDVWNCCSGTLSYAITEDIDWLSLSPTSGSSTGEHDTITMVCDTAQMATGTYYGEIVVSSTNGVNSPIRLPVKLSVGTIGDVFDNEDGPEIYEESGNWYTSSAPGYYGSNSSYSVDNGAIALWNVDVPLAGVYSVDAWWPSKSTRSESVRYDVEDKYGVTACYVDQRNTGNEWINLGMFAFDRGMGKDIRVTCHRNAQVGADAVRLVYYSDYSWDSDQDGFSDNEELIAGSSLIDGDDYFEITEVEAGPSTNVIVLYWESLNGRLYSVYSHTNLLTPWPMGSVYQVEGDGSTKSYMSAPSDGPSFFRIGVELAP